MVNAASSQNHTVSYVRRQQVKQLIEDGPVFRGVAVTELPGQDGVIVEEVDVTVPELIEAVALEEAQAAAVEAELAVCVESEWIG